VESGQDQALSALLSRHAAGGVSGRGRPEPASL